MPDSKPSLRFAYPPSSVVDQIIPYSELLGGDLVLYQGDFVTADVVSHTGDTTSFTTTLDGRKVQVHQVGTHIAVRRYTEG